MTDLFSCLSTLRSIFLGGVTVVGGSAAGAESTGGLGGGFVGVDVLDVPLFAVDLPVPELGSGMLGVVEGLSDVGWSALVGRSPGS